MSFRKNHLVNFSRTVGRGGQIFLAKHTECPDCGCTVCNSCVTVCPHCGAVLDKEERIAS